LCLDDVQPLLAITGRATGQIIVFLPAGEPAARAMERLGVQPRGPTLRAVT
jgi:hypothetical protein